MGGPVMTYVGGGVGPCHYIEVLWKTIELGLKLVLLYRGVAKILGVAKVAFLLLLFGHDKNKNSGRHFNFRKS